MTGNERGCLECLKISHPASTYPKILVCPASNRPIADRYSILCLPLVSSPVSLCYSLDAGDHVARIVVIRNYT